MTKIAVISDIHGNYPALLAVADSVDRFQPDIVVVNGDIVNRGPSSSISWRYVSTRRKLENWILLKGNHEDYVLQCRNPDFPRIGPAYEIMRFAYWTYNKLGKNVDLLPQLPDKFNWRAPDNSEFRVLHASMKNNRDGVYEHSRKRKLRNQILPAPAVFVTAHTHRPFQMNLDNTTIVNVGSVGSPFDEDWRPSYGQFQWTRSNGWTANIVRVPYDYRQAENDYLATGFLDEAGPLAQLMLIEHRRSHGLMYRWASSYQDAVLADEITLRDSVRELLKAEDISPYTGRPGWIL